MFRASATHISEEANNDGEHSHVTVAFSDCRGEYDVMRNSRSVDRENPLSATRLTNACF
jgi:hypothetical protein